MVYCTSCGTENKDTSRYCTKCGTELEKKDEASSEKETKKTQKHTSEKKVDEFENTAEQAAEEVGETCSRWGHRFERRMDHFGKQLETWPERHFGVIGPLISTFIGLIIVWIISYILQRGDEQFPILNGIGEILYTNLLLIFVLFLISNYNSYLLRKYKHQYQWISPAISTAVFVAWLWIIAKIFFILANELTIGFFETLGQFINTFLIAIFVVILLFSYGVKTVFFYTEHPEKT